jgi:SpoVK/Ycf46/Vps4 family AAA+-type ATPase
MTALDSLVGLDAVKAEVQSLRSFVVFQRDRIRQGFKQDPISLHLVFTGNPGTGKTTVARLIGDIYRSLGLLKKGHLVEVGRSDLVGAYVGQTEEKVQKVIARAMDGVLFIDEAYSLAVQDSKNDFGKHAIELLLTAMENHSDRLAVIAAGYTDVMKTFITSNAGLESRFGINPPFEFEDYTGKELTEIYRRLAQGNGYIISDARR